MSVNASVVKAFTLHLVKRTTITGLIRYLILIPLLAPKGFEELSSEYKSFMTAWSILALALMVLDSAMRLRAIGKLSFYPIGFMVYIGLAIAITATSSDGVTSGLQELFLFPAAILYLLGLDELEFKKYVVASSVALLALFAFQLIISDLLFSEFYHITFLGHVQVISQYGVLALLLSSMVAEKQLMRPFFPIALAILAIVVMVSADADSARFSLVVFLVVTVILKALPSLGRVEMRAVLLLGIALSIAVVLVTVSRQSPLMLTNVDWTFSGRLFVWESATELIQAAPLLGYGIENSQITVFWSDSSMSYAHNQVMQSLLDGGVVLFVAMVWMLSSVAACVNAIANLKTKTVCIAVFCAILSITIFDSFTPYSYVFMALAFMAREGMSSRRETSSGIRQDKA